MHRLIALTVTCLFAIAPQLPAQGGSAKSSPAAPTPRGDSSPNRLIAAHTVCGSGHSSGNSRFDPACYVQIFEDAGNNKRFVLHSPSHPAVMTRLLSVDAESTLIVDLSRGLEENQDLALNNFHVTATLNQNGASKPIEVIGYTEVGKSAEAAQSQRAFAFATFDDLAGKLMNLYYTTKDILYRVNKGEACFDAARTAETPGDAKTAGPCGLDAYLPDPKADSLSDRDKILATALQVYGPEAQTLTAFFSDDTHRMVNALISRRIFDIDVDSLEGIARQIKSNMDLLSQKTTSVPGQQEALYQIYYRLLLIANDLNDVHDAMGSLAELATNPAKLAPDGDLYKLCPHTVKGPPAFVLRPNESKSSSHTLSFAEACYIESEKNKYVAQLARYLVNGTISLADNNVADGDILVLTVEARGPDGNSLGAPAVFRIRATSYGMKGAVRDSIFFIKRIGVNAADPVHGLTPIRFSPFPGASLIATFHYRGDSSCPECNGADGHVYRLPSFGSGAKVLHALAPGAGINVSFMDFKDARDFNATTGQFTNTSGDTFELGVGPVVSLFNHRISVTYGYDLMAPARRTYWGLGFSFIDFTKDVVKYFKSK